MTAKFFYEPRKKPDSPVAMPALTREPIPEPVPEVVVTATHTATEIAEPTAPAIEETALIEFEKHEG